jgi:hypothetical protein
MADSVPERLPFRRSRRTVPRWRRWRRHTLSGHTVSGHTVSGHTVSGHTVSGHTVSGHLTGHTVLGHLSGHTLLGSSMRRLGRPVADAITLRVRPPRLARPFLYRRALTARLAAARHRVEGDRGPGGLTASLRHRPAARASSRRRVGAGRPRSAAGHRCCRTSARRG